MVFDSLHIQQTLGPVLLITNDGYKMPADDLRRSLINGELILTDLCDEIWVERSKGDQVS